MAYGAIRQALGLPKSVNLKQHRTYRIWYAMRSRCLYIAHHAWHRYGGRGITFDHRWNDFLCFLEDMGHPPSDNHSIDRIDVNGNYCKDNCKWSLPIQQQSNKSTSVIVEGGVSLKQFCTEHGLNYQAIWHQVRRVGVPLEQAINKQLRS